MVPFQPVLDTYGMGDKSLLQILFTDVDLCLMNTDFVLDFPKPTLPNLVPVGGLTTRPGNPPSAVSIYECQ